MVICLVCHSLFQAGFDYLLENEQTSDSTTYQILLLVRHCMLTDYVR